MKRPLLVFLFTVQCLWSSALTVNAQQSLTQSAPDEYNVGPGDVIQTVGIIRNLSDDELLEIENHACPGAGACGGQFTANTMATVMELIGLSPMGTAAVPQVDIRKEDVAFRFGEVILNAVRKNIRPRDIATRQPSCRNLTPGWPHKP